MAGRCKILRDRTLEGLEKQINDYMSIYNVESVSHQHTNDGDGKPVFTAVVMYEEKRKQLLEG